MAVVLSWGEPTIYTKKKGEETWAKIEYPPVEGSTTLETTEGNKTEAKVEGGENEAVRYAKNTYTLNTQFRYAQGRKKPIKTSDGLSTDQYAVMVVPENVNAPALYIEDSNVHSTDSYTSADGGMIQYKFDALRASTGDQIKWGTATIDGSTHLPTSFVELDGTSNLLE